MSESARWSENDLSVLRLMRSYGLPFSLIAQTLRRSEQAIIVQAARLKIQAPRKSGVEDDEVVVLQNKFLAMDTKLVGSITEDQVRIRLAMEGYDLFLPYMNNHKTDLAIVRGSLLCKLQVKAAVYDKENKRFRAQLRTKDKDGLRISYRKEDVDFFVVKCNGIEEFYVVPYELGVKQHNLNLYPHRLKMRVAGLDFEPFRNAFNLIDNFFMSCDKK